MSNSDKSYDKKLTRLTSIMIRLNEGEALSTKQLVEDFNVTSKTIQRDFNRLVRLYPIYREKWKWKMQDGYKIEKAKSFEETLVLDILEKMSNNLGNSFSTKAKQLLSKIKNENFNPIYTRLNIEDISENIQSVAVIEVAIKEKKHIKCDYSFLAYKSSVEIKPLKIANFEGIWYLIALDARNDKLKKYHLKSIGNIKVTDSEFKINDDLEKPLENAVNVWFNDEEEPFEVILYLNKHAAKTLKRRAISKSQRVLTEYKDGSCDISLMITHDREIISIIQYWLPHIKVVSPERISEYVLKNCEKFIEAYKS
jgi:predicted DNA-binding transcriptional regulator YafY